MSRTRSTLSRHFRLSAHPIVRAARAEAILAIVLFWLGSTVVLAQEPMLPSPVNDIEPTVVGSEEYYDPLEPLNRRIFRFNDFIYRNALIPLSAGYQRVVPAPARSSLLSAFRNIQEPFNAFYNTAQGEFRPAGSNILRFAINSTIGLLGLFDPAEAWLNIESAPNSLNETLMAYGVDQGAYLTLPFFGSSDIRSGLSQFAGSYFHPVSFVTNNPETSALISFDAFQLYAPAAESYIGITADSEDPYLYLRNQYLQGIARDQDTIDEQ